MCIVLKVSRNSFYRWYSGVPSKRDIDNQLFTKLIKKEYVNSKKRYGSPKSARILKSKGHHISEKRVAKLMRLNGWFSIVKNDLK